MKTRLFTLVVVSGIVGLSLTNCDSTNQEGTDSFERSMNDGEFSKKDRAPNNTSGEYEKNYPGDSI